MPTPEALASFYPPVYTFSLPTQTGKEAKSLLARLEYQIFFRLQYTAQVESILHGVGWRHGCRTKLLDIGCGRGLRLLTFRDKGLDVCGVDFDKDAVEFLSREFGIPATRSDMAGLDSAFEKSSFDLITAFYILEHVLSIEEVLESCHKLLKPGGWFVGAVPLVDGLQAKCLGKNWSQVTEAPRHISLPSKRGLTSVFKALGYESIVIKPDTLFNCAGSIGLSLFPKAASTYVYGDRAYISLIRRLLAAACTFASFPFCFFENYLVRRPSLGLVFARRMSGR